MQEQLGRDELALERTIMAAGRTYSAWVRSGLAGVGGGLAVARLLDINNHENRVVAGLIAALLVIWGAVIFIYAIIDYRRTCAKLKQEGQTKNSLQAFSVMTAVLVIVAALALWITLR